MRPYRVAFAYLLVLAGCLFFVIKGRHDESLTLQSVDFKQPYASARCLLKHCNPYSETDTRAAFIDAGGALGRESRWLFVPYSALYPPSTLALLAPFAALPYPAAHNVWLIFSGISFSVAGFAIADLSIEYSTFWVPALLAVFLASSTILLMEGQISGIEVAFVAIGVWSLIRNKAPLLGVFLLGCALALKPHDSWLVAVYFLFAGKAFRRRFWQMSIVAAAITLAGCFWCWANPASVHWFHNLMVNVSGNTRTGGVDDPGLSNNGVLAIANLQTLISVFISNPHFYNLVTYAICGALVFALFYFAAKSPNSPEKHLVGIAAAACITILPIYHRQYDTRILILAFPAAAVLLAYRKRWGWCGLVLTAIAGVATCHIYLRKLGPHFLRIFASFGHFSIAQRLQMALLYRPLPLIMLILAVFFIAALRNTTRKDNRDVQRPLPKVAA